MSLKTYDRERYISRDDGSFKHPWYFIHHLDDPNGGGPLKPGDWVQHVSRGGKRIVIAVNDDNLTILWSDYPRTLQDFSSIVLPRVRGLCPQNLFQIQLMPSSSSGLFYEDYKRT